MSTPMKLLMAAILVLGPLAGFIVGRLTAPEAGDERVLSELAHQRVLLERHIVADAHPPTEVRCAVATATGAAVDTDRLRAEAAQAVREELGRGAAEGAPDAGSQALSPEAAARSLAARQEGQRILDNAISARRWTMEDRQAMRRALGDMAPAQRGEVMRQLITTLNSNTLKVEVRGAPF